MNSVAKWCLATVLTGFMFLGSAPPVSAQENDQGGPGQRLDRLEQKVRHLAEQQEQLMRRIGPLLERQEQQRPPGPGAMRPAPMGREWFPGRGQPGGPEAMRPAFPPPGPPPALAAHALHKVGGFVRLVVLVWLIANILLAVWIYTDIRKRGDGPGVLIALALLAGIPAAVIYALVRIGDKKA